MTTSLIGPYKRRLPLVLWALALYSGGCFFEIPPEPDVLVANIAAERYQLFRTNPSADSATLQVIIVGGQGPYACQWAAIDPLGAEANDLLSSTDGVLVEFQVGDIDGPYEILCHVTDSLGQEFDARTVLQVGGAIGLDITTERLGVMAGGGALGQTRIQLNPSSGTPPFTVSWSCVGPDGKIDDDRLDVSDPLAPVFTSSDQVGTYSLTATLTDALGDSAVESAVVVVGQILGLDVIADRSWVLPGGLENGSATLLATPIGGTAPYAYDWEVISPDGEDATGLLWDTSVASPIFESAHQTGTFVVRCAVTDTTGTVLIGSTRIVVGSQISLDLSADRLALPSSDMSAAQAVLNARIRGGTKPITADWQVFGPTGAERSSLLSGSGTYARSFIPDTERGTFIVRCTVSDADGVAATDSLTLTVGGLPGVTVSTTRVSLATGGGASTGTAALTARVYGGLPPYTYQWSVRNPLGADELARLNDATQANPVFTSDAQVGVYALSCTVTDAAGALAVDALTLSVGQPLNVDVTVDKQTLVGGGGVAGQAQLISTVNGGTAPYTYQWSAVDPTNTPAPGRLSSTTSANPVFTSALLTGTYRLTLTTTDALGVIFVDSVELVVGSTGGGAVGSYLSADVAVEPYTIGPSGETADLSVTTIGGVAPLTYAWTVTEPGGATNNAYLDSATAATVTFTSTALQGTFRARCTVTDAVGNLFTDSVQLTVDDLFTLDLQAAVTQVVPGGTVALLADRTGGAAQFTYTWNCVNEAGTPAGTFTTGSLGIGAAAQTAADDGANTWTAPASGPGTFGAYRITVTATDTTGRNFTDSVTVNVTQSFAVDLSAAPIFISPGESIDLVANRTGGCPDFTYTWTCRNEASALVGAFTNGPTGVGLATQVGADDTTNAWTAPATGANILGTYRIEVTVTDDAGSTAVDSIPVMVQAPLALTLTANDIFVTPSTLVTLAADQAGGVGPYAYTWSAATSADVAAGTFTAGSTGIGQATQADLAGDALNEWSADTEDTYTLRCTVTDNAGQSASATLSVIIDREDILALEVTPNRLTIAPGETVDLQANQTGGIPNLTYAWTCRNEASALAGAFTNGPTGVGLATQVGADDTTNAWTAPATGANILGTYRIEVTVTDDAGSTAVDSIPVMVQAPLTLALTANDIFVTPATLVTLAADQTGGVGPYTYTWSAVTSADVAAGTFTIGSTGVGQATQAGAAGDTLNEWSADAEDAYTLRCTVTDNAGQSASTTLSIIINLEDNLTLEVTSNRLVIAPGETVDLQADQTGGIPDLDYTWTARDEDGAAAGTFGSASQTNQADDVANTWTAPASTEGTYRLTCSLTDSAGRTVSDTTQVEVTTLAVQNTFLAPAASAGSTDSLLTDTVLTNAATQAYPGQTLTSANGLGYPVHPRNMVITLTDQNADGSITGGFAEVIGYDARGIPRSETIALSPSAGASSVSTAALPFAIVTQVNIYELAGAATFPPGLADTVQIGVGNKFGLTGFIDDASDILYVNEGGTVLTTGFTVDATPGQQGITFIAAPNGTRDYTVVFRAR